MVLVGLTYLLTYMVLVGGGEPEVEGTRSGVMCMRQARCGDNNLVRCVTEWRHSPHLG